MKRILLLVNYCELGNQNTCELSKGNSIINIVTTYVDTIEDGRFDSCINHFSFGAACVSTNITQVPIVQCTFQVALCYFSK